MIDWILINKYLIIAILFLSGILIGMNLNYLPSKRKDSNTKSIEKLITLLSHIDQDYVDDINMDSLVSKIIIDIDNQIKRDSIIE